MTTLQLVIAPDQRLKEVAAPVDAVDDNIREIIAEMFEIMYRNNGCGLAANQVGVLKRIFIVDLPEHMDKTLPRHVFINPEITYFSEDRWTVDEGCLSFPLGDRINIERPVSLAINYLDEQGRTQQLSPSGWLARAIQHELDHINGITIADHTSKIKRDLILKKHEKYKKTLQ